MGNLLTDWQFEPVVFGGVALAALLYYGGFAYSKRHGSARGVAWWRAACFGLGLLAILVALESSLDDLADTRLWAHMVQHEILIMVAPPLLLLGMPLLPMWRAVPLRLRRSTLGWTMRQRWPRRLWHTVGAWLLAPIPAFVLFVADFSLWHHPALYDAALASQNVHSLEHLTFLATALLFWVQVIPARPVRPRLGYIGRTLYLGVAGLYSSLVGGFFMFSVAPYYSHYAALERSAGDMSALVDQHLAGAAMDVPGVIVFFVAMCALLWLWLGEDQRAAAAEPARLTTSRAAVARARQ